MRRNEIACKVVLCVFGLMVTVQHASAATANLLDNGGFETPGLAPWSDLGTGVTVTNAAADVHGGHGAVAIHNGSGIRRTLSLHAGATFTLAFYAKAQKDNRLRADVTSVKGPLTPAQSISGETYQLYEIDFSVQRATDVTISIWKDQGTGSGLGYADDFTLIEKTPEHFGDAFPGNAPLINVKSLGAVGDGVHDDTAAIQSAIARCAYGFIFLPSGTYLISSTLQWKSIAGKWKCDVGLCGESRQSTTLKLKDGTFTRSDSAEAMIKTASQDDWGDGQGNEAFNNFIEDLTIDAGEHNPGAIGIDYIGNNRAAIRNVLLRSGNNSGAIGIAMKRRYVGPCLLKNISIRGFDIGIDVSHQDYSMTMEHLSLAGQRVVGIRNADNILSIHDLHSDNAAPALSNTTSMGLVTLVGANFEHGSPEKSAMVNSGALYLRDISCTGYRSALQGVPGSSLRFYTSSAPMTLDGSSASPLALPIQETPDAYCGPIEQWADPGLSNGADDTAAIAAAMNSGKHTIYFRSPSYQVADTITVPDSVWRIVGMSARILPMGPKFADAHAPLPVFRFTGTTHDVVVEHLSFGNWDYSAPGAIYVEDASPKALALVDASGEGGMHHFYQNVAGRSGALFIENIYLPGSSAKAATTWQFDHQRVWARQFNEETDIQRIINKSGDLWILGLKTERVGTIIETTDAGRTEVLGGLIYPLHPSSTAAFIARDASQSLTYATTAYESAANDYETQVEQNASTGRRSLTHGELVGRGLSRGLGSMVPLLVGTPASTQPLSR